MEDQPTNHSHLSCHSSGIPAPVSWWLVRHFAQIPNLKMSSMPLSFHMLGLLLVSTISCGRDVGHELLPELTVNPGTTRGTKVSVLQMMPFSMFGSIVALDR